MEFPTTQWSLLALATLNGDSSASEALGDFYQRYRQPVTAFIQQRGFDRCEAEDLAQDFVVHLLKTSLLRRADAGRGRFRSFLLGALVRFLDDARTRRARLKRGGGVLLLSLDDERFIEEGTDVSSADISAFDYEWALDLLDRATHATEAYYVDRDRVREFSILRAYLPGGVQPPPYEESAARLSMTLAAFKTEVHRLRTRFRDQLRHEIAATVRSPHEIRDEIVYLGRVLQNGAEVKPGRRF